MIGLQYLELQTLRAEAPSAYITAYELQYSQLRSFVDGYMNILSPQNNAGTYGNSKNPGLDFYKGLYTVKNNAIARLNFPFLKIALDHLVLSLQIHFHL
jgi:hypothetical protein